MNGGACYAIDIIHVATRLESTYMEQEKGGVYSLQGWTGTFVVFRVGPVMVVRDLDIDLSPANHRSPTLKRNNPHPHSNPR